MSTYHFIIGTSVVIILSYLFNVLSKKTNIPSVVMLILLGLGIQYLAQFAGIEQLIGDSLTQPLEILGVVGLIFIVLEAALDLKLTREKLPLIFKSFFTALLGLGGTTFLIAYIIRLFYPEATLLNSVVYAIPLSILSSAIIIPSVENLAPQKKEFMVYESTFSDILGIMFFYLLLDNAGKTNVKEVTLAIQVNIGLTILVSIFASYLLVYILQKIPKSHTKLYVLISILLLLYAIGKLMHLSPLVIILMFGLIMNNTKLFFPKRLKNLIDSESQKSILHSLHEITMESAFVVRTLFFVVFGMSISIMSIFNPKVLVISILIMVIMYGLRFILLRVFAGKNMVPEIFIAPRGLITILLFYAIPKTEQFQIEGFSTGILLCIILGSAIVMTWALVKEKKKQKIADIKHMYDDVEEAGDESEEIEIE